MPDARVGGRRLIYLTILWALALLPGLGGSVRLTYHEAFVAQGRGRSLLQATGRTRRLVVCHGWKNHHCLGGLSLVWGITVAG